MGTLAEVEFQWTICDLADANEFMDIKEEAEKFYADQARRSTGKGDH